MHDRRTHRPPWWPLCLGLAVSIGMLSCAPTEVAPELPRGPLIAGDARALEHILDALGQLESTPVAREAERARAAVGSCNEFVASTESTAWLFERPQCDSEAQLSPALRELRGDAALVFVWPMGDADPAEDPHTAPRLHGRIYVEADGSVRIEARLDRLPDTIWSRLLVPDDEPAGPARLASREALIQGRFRPRAGLDLASLVPSGSQADSMFRLKSELFVGAALGDAWEFAIYMPQPGAAMPPMAISVDVASASLAERAVSAFIGELEATWPIKARAAQWAGGASGACFYELKIMPEFAPCYALRDDALVFGWNPLSIGYALAQPTQGIAPLHGGLLAHLDRFAEADARLQGVSLEGLRDATGRVSAESSLPAVSSPPPSSRGRYPFSELAIETRARAAAVEFDVRLSTGAP